MSTERRRNNRTSQTMAKKGSVAGIREKLDNDRKELNEDRRKRTLAVHSQYHDEIHMMMRSTYFLLMRPVFIFVPYTFLSLIHCGTITQESKSLAVSPLTCSTHI